MGIGLSVSARTEITAKYARAYRAASRVVKSRLLDEVVAVTGWSRDNARRRLGQAVKPRAVRPRSGRPRKFSKEAIAILERVWAISGGSCGKYLAVAMPHLLEALEAHGELVSGKRRYCREVRGELLAMSAASIDRYLAAAKARGALRGISTTKPGTLLRNSITIRKAGDEVEADPGFFEADTVAHCGPTLKGEFARTVNLTDMVTGWVFTTAVRNNARVHIIAALDRAVATIPFPIVGPDFDNGSEFINHDLVAWAGEPPFTWMRRLSVDSDGRQAAIGSASPAARPSRVITTTSSRNCFGHAPGMTYVFSAASVVAIGQELRRPSAAPQPPE
jgi:hypothetical protein